MTVEQYTTGTVYVRTGSSVVYGTNTLWNQGNVNEGHTFKLNEDAAKNYTIATILSATRLQLAKRYANASYQGYSYMITRSYTPYRSYARFYAQDTGVGDVLREQIVNKVDTDIGRIYDGSASLHGCTVVSTNGAHWWRMFTDATGNLIFAFEGRRKAYVASQTGAWTT